MLEEATQSALRATRSVKTQTPISWDDAYQTLDMLDECKKLRAENTVLSWSIKASKQVIEKHQGSKRCADDNIQHLKGELSAVRGQQAKACGSTRIIGGYCEVCNDSKWWQSLAKHQVQAKHGEIWAAQQAETASAKKRRLNSERKERRQWKRSKHKIPN